MELYEVKHSFCGAGLLYNIRYKVIDVIGIESSTQFGE